LTKSGETQGKKLTVLAVKSKLSSSVHDGSKANFRDLYIKLSMIND
jgi:hypothetical protein